MKKIIAALTGIILAIIVAPVANAQMIECTVSGFMIIVALDSPVVVCSFDANPQNTNSIAPSIQLPIRLGEHAP